MLIEFFAEVSMYRMPSRSASSYAIREFRSLTVASETDTSRSPSKSHLFPTNSILTVSIVYFCTSSNQPWTEAKESRLLIPYTIITPCEPALDKIKNNTFIISASNGLESFLTCCIPLYFQVQPKFRSYNLQLDSLVMHFQGFDFLLILAGNAKNTKSIPIVNIYVGSNSSSYICFSIRKHTKNRRIMLDLPTAALPIMRILQSESLIVRFDKRTIVEDLMPSFVLSVY